MAADETTSRRGLVRVSQVHVEVEATMDGMDETRTVESTATSLDEAIRRCKTTAVRSDAFDTDDIRNVRIVAGSFESGDNRRSD